MTGGNRSRNLCSGNPFPEIAIAAFAHGCKNKVGQTRSRKLGGQGAVRINIGLPPFFAVSAHPPVSGRHNMSDNSSALCEGVFLAGSDICGVGVPSHSPRPMTVILTCRYVGVYTRKWP